MNSIENIEGHRWDHYFLRQGDDCFTFWKDYLLASKRNVLFVLGLGFDPRMCLGLKMLIDVSPHSVKKCLLIEYDEGENSPSHQYDELIKKNSSELLNLMRDAALIQKVQVPMWSTDKKRRTGSMRAGEVIPDSIFDQFTDIVLDISSMPRTIYFPIIAKVLHFLDSRGARRVSANFHIIVPEQITIDRNIQEEGIDDNASYMHGFTSDLVQESTAAVPKIWIPVLGEGKETQLIRIYDSVRPDEICPVLPSPSMNPRRADDLIVEYRDLLFDRLDIEPTNFIYASERNPFEVYRQIFRTMERYNDALDALGKCKIVISALSSKLLSVGALLAAYEAKRKEFMVGISHVETYGYKICGTIALCNPQLFTLWVAGDCYNVRK